MAPQLFAVVDNRSGPESRRKLRSRHLAGPRLPDWTFDDAHHLMQPAERRRSAKGERGGQSLRVKPACRVVTAYTHWADGI